VPKKNHQWRIGVDARLAGLGHAGIGRYIQSLLIRLPSLSSQVEWVFFFSNQDQARAVLGELINLPQVTVKTLAAPHYSWLEQLSLPVVFSQAKLDLLHVPHFNAPVVYRGKLVITIHDLLWHEYRGSGVTTLPAYQYWFKYLAYRLVAGQAIRHAERIFVPAQTIKQVVSEQYRAAGRKIVVTMEGSSFDQVRLPHHASARDAKQLLYVGSLYPHKNLNLVLSALQHLTDYQLLIVSSRNAFQAKTKQQVAELNLGSRVQFKEAVTDLELTELLSQSSALVQPSFSEGFGLTGVEAMSLGVPVLASQIPIFAEIYRDGCIYFDPTSVESFVAAVSQLETSNKSLLATRAKRVAARYSWDKMAEQTLAGYLAVLKS